jgi:hypothetical protein
MNHEDCDQSSLTDNYLRMRIVNLSMMVHFHSGGNLLLLGIIPEW